MPAQCACPLPLAMPLYLPPSPLLFSSNIKHAKWNKTIRIQKKKNRQKRKTAICIYIFFNIWWWAYVPLWLEPFARWRRMQCARKSTNKYESATPRQPLRPSCSSFAVVYLVVASCACHTHERMQFAAASHDATTTQQQQQ